MPWARYSQYQCICAFCFKTIFHKFQYIGVFRIKTSAMPRPTIHHLARQCTGLELSTWICMPNFIKLFYVTVKKIWPINKYSLFPPNGECYIHIRQYNRHDIYKSQAKHYRQQEQVMSKKKKKKKKKKILCKNKEYRCTLYMYMYT